MLNYLLLVAVVLGPSSAAIDQAEEKKAVDFLAYYNRVVVGEDYKSNEASWKYATNLTEYNKKIKTQISVKFSLFMQQARANASAFNVSKLSEDSKRQINMIKSSASPKSEMDVTTLNDMESEMESIYSGGTVIDKDGKKLQLDPELTAIMRSNRDYDRLLFAWKGWRTVTGHKLRPIYERFVKLSNKGAKENGWADKGAYWRSWYEVDDLESAVEDLYNDLKPLYQELHAYVRHKLSSKYPGKFGKSDPIPAHLFGNMWAQSWINIYDLVEPYKGQPSLDVTKNLEKKNYTATKMVELAESFFVSIGLKPLPKSFYQKSLIEKPKDGRGVICHASAWDFAINRDVRIKQCTTITHNYLVTTHHELGHIQYYLQYWNLPYEYRTGANPGFHEAVGDTLSLSVDTPQHLKIIGLLDTLGTSKESDINALMKMAMSKIAFLPFGFLIDQWRWNVFRGKITPDNYNQEWWKLRTKYQGIKPPVERTEKDFDPGAKYHIPANTPYIRYFVSYVLQFQFHKAACAAAGFKGPLHQCSIYNSTAAGKKLGDMLSMGKSKPWPDALEKMTGTRKMDVGPLKEYFEPLRKWMEDQRKEHNYPLGWEGEQPTAVPTQAPATQAPPSSSSSTFASVLLTAFALLLSKMFY